MQVAFKHFSSSVGSWESLFAEAAAFATEVGRDRLIGISHSHGGGTTMMGVGGEGVVTVWYWSEAGSPSGGD
jgi:hypothetical protein